MSESHFNCRLHQPAHIVTLTRSQVRALDRYAIDELGIPGMILMENAACAIEEALLLAFDPTPGTPILIACGPGNNGGDGLALARRLNNRGHTHITIGLARRASALTGDAATNLHIATQLNLHIVPLENALRDANPNPLIIVDALFGTGLDRPMKGDDELSVLAINALGAARSHVLAIDLPSGMDADTGEAQGGVAVHAEVTLTLACLKPGLLTPAGASLAGRVQVGDIGVSASAHFDTH